MSHIESSDPHVARSVAVRGLLLELHAKGQKALRIEYPRSVFDAGGPEATSPAGSGKFFGILGSGADERIEVPLENGLGIVLRASTAGGRLAYDARLPLGRDEEHLYGLGAAPGATLSLTISTPEVKEIPGGGPVRHGGMGHGDRGGGMRPGMGGEGMGRGMGRGGMGGREQPLAEGEAPDRAAHPRLPPAFKLKAKITLARPPAVA